MNYEEMLQIASTKSDHGSRVIEIKPAIEESIQNTLPKYPALEIGNRDGGSAIYILWHLYNEGKERYLVTCDVTNAPPALAALAHELNVDWAHFKMKQEKFVVKNQTKFGFCYLDADHIMENVVRDVRILAPFLVSGGILAIDDVETWPTLPDLSDVGLERVNYEVDQGNRLGLHGQHILFYRRD